MNEHSANSSQTNIFFPNFNFSKNCGSPEWYDKENLSGNLSPLPSDSRSPLLTLNFTASPVFRFYEDPKLSPMPGVSPRDSPVIFGDHKSKFKLNPKIEKRKKDNSGLTDLGNISARKTMVRREDERGIHDATEIAEEQLKSMLYATESTVHESNMKYVVNESQLKNGKLGDASFFNSDSEDQSEFKSKRGGLPKKEKNELSVKKLLKMEPLFCFFVRFFNDCGWTPICSFEQLYELRILKALMRPIGFKNPEMLNEDNFILANYLTSKPKPPIGARNGFNLVMRMAYKRLKSLFLFDLREERLTPDQKTHLFLRHYFAEINGDDSNFDKFDFFDKGNLSKTRIELILGTFKSKLFLRDVSRFVEKDLKSVLDGYRSRKLHRLFLNWEQLFLESKSEAEAVAGVFAEIKSARFVWVYSDEVYFQAFDVYARK